MRIFRQNWGAFSKIVERTIFKEWYGTQWRSARITRLSMISGLVIGAFIAEDRLLLREYSSTLKKELVLSETLSQS